MSCICAFFFVPLSEIFKARYVCGCARRQENDKTCVKIDIGK